MQRLTSGDDSASFQVEHLATFSTASPQQTPTTPKMALQRLFAMEKTSGIWTQRMAIQVEGKEDTENESLISVNFDANNKSQQLSLCLLIMITRSLAAFASSSAIAFRWQSRT